MTVNSTNFSTLFSEQVFACCRLVQVTCGRFFLGSLQLKMTQWSQNVCPLRSRSEQVPGSEFHPRDESEKNDCRFLGPSWCNKKVNHET